jgi:hypothetical protein
VKLKVSDVLAEIFTLGRVRDDFKIAKQGVFPLRNAA